MKERGISLIALIITIIVIIILAAISIAGVSGMVERSRYAKFCGDLDAVQDAVSQAYGTKQIKEAQKPDGLKSSEEIYKWVAVGEDGAEPQPTTGPNGENLYQLENKNNNLGLDLPKYGDSAWGVDPKTGEVFLVDGFEYENHVYYSKTDVQNGGKEKDEAGGETEDPSETPTEDYIGYYADVDGDGDADGVIFADLAVGSGGEKEWEPTDWRGGTFTIPAEPLDSLKEYEVIESTYNDGHFGDHPMLAPIDTPENKEKNDRFYVMALNDIDENKYWFYYNAPMNFSTTEKRIEWTSTTSTTFGSGKENTDVMFEKWDSETWGEKTENGKVSDYGDETHADMWGVVQEKREKLKTNTSKEWFVPSRDEWNAFGYNLKITNETPQTSYGLSTNYWSSSISGEDPDDSHFFGMAWVPRYGTHGGFMNPEYVGNFFNYSGFYVRLATTF